VATEIPRTLSILWGDEERLPKSVYQVLNRDRIVAAAIGIADRDGLAALSMARVAESVGNSTMALYRHVANKDELLVFMLDAAPGPPPELPSGWRAGLRAWAEALRTVYYAHPWILQVTAGRPPLEPGQLAWLDRGLSALAGQRLTVHQRYDIVMSVLQYVRGEAQLMTGVAGGGPAAGADYGALIAHFVRPERFPALSAAIQEGLFAPDPADDDDTRTFYFGLDRLLDGCQEDIDAC
jgi:AcrR family transcriptional regulator